MQGIVHEDGHVINITAIRNRSAFVDWPSSLFAEAFADEECAGTHLDEGWSGDPAAHADCSKRLLKEILG